MLKYTVNTNWYEPHHIDFIQETPVLPTPKVYYFLHHIHRRRQNRYLHEGTHSER